jgi:hypothetical protein
MRIEGVYRSHRIFDQESQIKYGKSEGIPIGPDPNLDTDEKCAFLGSIIVATYKDPLKAIRDVRTIQGFDFELGTEYTISVAEMQNVPCVLREVRYAVEGHKFDTYLNFAERYIPKPERLLAILKNQMERFGWDIEAWKKAQLPAGIIPTRSDLIKFWGTDKDFALRDFTQAQNLFVLGESDAGWTSGGLSGSHEISVGMLKLVGILWYLTAKAGAWERTRTEISTKFKVEVAISGTDGDRAFLGIGETLFESYYGFVVKEVSNELQLAGRFCIAGVGTTEVDLGPIDNGQVVWCRMNYDPDNYTSQFFVDGEYWDKIEGSIWFNHNSLSPAMFSVIAGTTLTVYGFQVSRIW